MYLADSVMREFTANSWYMRYYLFGISDDRVVVFIMAYRVAVGAMALVFTDSSKFAVSKSDTFQGLCGPRTRT